MLVPVGEHINRLVATRFQWDLMGCENLIIARTDSESGKLLSSAIDARDHEYILGVTEDVEPLAETIQVMDSQGATGEEIDRYEAAWVKDNTLVTFDEGVFPGLPNRCKYVSICSQFNSCDQPFTLRRGRPEYNRRLQPKNRTRS